MKKTILAFAALAVTLVSAASQADEPCPNSVSADVRLIARFVTLPDAPSYEAKGEGAICYSIDSKGAVVVAASVPRLVFHEKDLPGGLGETTAFVEPMPGVDPVISWENFPEVRLTNVDLRVRAFKGAISPDGAGPEPFIDIILPRMEFRTGPIEVEGVESMGFVDADTLTAQLVASSILPEDDDPLYSEWLAGQPVLWELVVQMKNPYQKD